MSAYEVSSHSDVPKGTEEVQSLGTRDGSRRTT